MFLGILHSKRIWAAVVVFLSAALLLPRPAAAYTPESKEVKEHVKRALAYLAAAKEDRLGGVCLIALCFKKAGVEKHPTIDFALKRCYEQNLKESGACNNYSLGIALMFLCEVDAKQHRPLIEKYVTEMFERQKSFGGWSYPDFKTGDTSQTQYAVLGMWMAKNYAELDIPVERIENCCGWLMRTQDASGGWGYQGTDPGSFVRMDQNKSGAPVTLTLSASGAGSLYMMADLLQVTKRQEVASIQIPKALQEVKAADKVDPRAPLTKELDPENIKSYLAAADAHLGSGFTPQVKWNHYYMYALERYQSFRERAGNGKGSRWYDEGFEFLAKTHQTNGSWLADSGEDHVVSTCFATLFLLRSAKKTIVEKLRSGTMIARGRLPNDVRSISQAPDGTLKKEGGAIPTAQILAAIDDLKNEEIARLADEREALELSKNRSERQSQIEKLRTEVGAGDYNVRLVVVMTLSKDRDLENVPHLLYALTDPDNRIVLQADRGLKFISRKVHGVGLPDSEPSKDQIKAAQDAWKAWYFTIRPDADLLN